MNKQHFSTVGLSVRPQIQHMNKNDYCDIDKITFRKYAQKTPFNQLRKELKEDNTLEERIFELEDEMNVELVESRDTAKALAEVYRVSNSNRRRNKLLKQSKKAKQPPSPKFSPKQTKTQNPDLSNMFLQLNWIQRKPSVAQYSKQPRFPSRYPQNMQDFTQATFRSPLRDGFRSQNHNQSPSERYAPPSPVGSPGRSKLLDLMSGAETLSHVQRPRQVQNEPNLQPESNLWDVSLDSNFPYDRVSKTLPEYLMPNFGERNLNLRSSRNSLAGAGNSQQRRQSSVNVYQQSQLDYSQNFAQPGDLFGRYGSGPDFDPLSSSLGLDWENEFTRNTLQPQKQTSASLAEARNLNFGLDNHLFKNLDSGVARSLEPMPSQNRNSFLDTSHLRISQKKNAFDFS
eukprot:snap_masked-scaffold_2-processed-gene-23.41-mRNA-1 protein AED:1.00 eAED:1.00 QI:0/-1/0/0/-1/1/1/0/399